MEQELKFNYRGELKTGSELKALLPVGEEYKAFKKAQRKLQSEISNCEDNIYSIQKRIETLEEKLEELSEGWKEEEARLGLKD